MSNAALDQSPVSVRLDDYQLDDRYRRESGRIFLTGSQALTRIMLDQARRDHNAGLNTAGFVTGYRGSPLGGVDQAMWRAEKFLKKDNIEFLPAINEDLAATAVLGTQQVELESDRIVDGVFSMWYGKGPGVDRAGDALKHGNAYGSSPHGGVLVIAGDDHGCVSSSMSHQSDVAFMAWYMPTLNPASIEEYLEFGAYGFALSRFSGMWIGFKAISETVESAASVAIPARRDFISPSDFEMPEGGLNFRWPDLPGMQIETRMKFKKEAVRAFARANPIDRTIYDVESARYGIITTGKGHLDVMEALAMLGVDEKKAREIGLDIYKIGLVWPLENEAAARFMANKEEVLVIEEKRGIIESQLKEYIYDRSVSKPKLILGKHDENGAPLISWVDELTPSELAPIIAGRLQNLFPLLDFSTPLTRIEEAAAAIEAPGGAKRLPYFCSGCPHNTSTRVPEGSKALAGIGCHFMASWMDRDTSSLIQMGGEGVNWASKSMFLKDRPHIFQNLGDGTYYHSGSMAIRQSIAAGANITYKILFNDAVAMTGGQPVDGVITVPMIARQLEAEGVKKIVIVSDQPKNVAESNGLPLGVEIHHRDELDEVQRGLREIKGVTALIYEQTCAAEIRRRRKRGEYPAPTKRVFINELVCEGCGDCSKQSNCLSIVPLETEFGRKRKIDQSSCNKDYSCLKGFCPSFVTIEGGELNKPKTRDETPELKSLLANLPSPTMPSIDRSYDLLVAGVGGTGVVTIGAIITMAAHLEGKGASVLDFMGFAQKGGSVMSYVRLGADTNALNQVRINAGEAKAIIACDLVVATDPRSLSVMRKGETRAVTNVDIMPTADFIRDRNIDFGAHSRVKSLRNACGDNSVVTIDATEIALRLLGDSVFSNMFLLGFAWQNGLIPLLEDSLRRAVELNGVAVKLNERAFALGRAAALNPGTVIRAAGLVTEKAAKRSVYEIIESRAAFLKQYQNRSYAERYRSFTTDVVKQAESIEGGEEFSCAVAKFLFKIMAYKDEYEVARLYTEVNFKERVAAEFSGNYHLKFHMAPPIFNTDVDDYGRPKKAEFGHWMFTALSVLSKFRFLRGTAFDPFGNTSERKIERKLIDDYRETIAELTRRLSKNNLKAAIEIASLPDEIRGYGPVKLESIRLADERLAALMKSFDEMSHASAVA